MRNLVLFGISVAGVVGCGLWMYSAPGWEPGLGLLAGIGGTISAWPRSSRRKLTVEEKVEAREKWRPIFQKFFWENAQKNWGTDAIVHDIKRADIYPEMPEGKGISPWFRVGLMGTYDRGIILGLRWTLIKEQPNGGWKEVSAQEHGAKKVILVGKVPYECIERVNWDGDDYYNKPHIFLHFDFKKAPYERLVYALEHERDKQPPYYEDVGEYTPPPGPSIWRRLISFGRRGDQNNVG